MAIPRAILIGININMIPPIFARDFNVIPPIFARAVEEDIWILAICADYLEDHGKDGSILRLIADNHFLLDVSGYNDNNLFNVVCHGCGYGDRSGDGYGYGLGGGIFRSGFGYGLGYGETDGDGRRMIWVYF